MNLKLKGALVSVYGSQAAASQLMGIPERKLSRIIHGFEKPSPIEEQKIQKYLGVQLTEVRAE